MKTADLCRKHGISDATFYNWKSKYGGTAVSEAARLRTSEDQKLRLKKLMADHGFSERRTCRLIGLSRSAWQYEGLRGQDDAVRERIREISNERRWFGYRRLAIVLK